MKNFLLEVRNIKECEGGYSCILAANGKKVAFIAPDIFEWSSYSSMNDIVEFYLSKVGKSSKPEELSGDWMSSDSPHSRSDKVEKAQAELRSWVDGIAKKTLKAKAIKELCKTKVLTISSGRLLDWKIPASCIRSRTDFEDFKAKLLPEEILLNGMSIEAIMKVVGRIR